MSCQTGIFFKKTKWKFLHFVHLYCTICHSRYFWTQFFNLKMHYRKSSLHDWNWVYLHLKTILIPILFIPSMRGFFLLKLQILPPKVCKFLTKTINLGWSTFLPAKCKVLYVSAFAYVDGGESGNSPWCDDDSRARYIHP